MSLQRSTPKNRGRGRGMLLAVALAAFVIVPTGTAAQAAGEFGSISGTVTSGSPAVGVSGVEVTLRLVGGFGETSILTDANGDYILQDVQSGHYVVRFTPNQGGLAREFYNDATRDGLATTVDVFGGAVMTGIDAFLEPGNTIEGTVTDSGIAHSAIPDVRVSLWPVQDESRRDLVFTTTDSLGDFQISGIPQGQYYLYFDTVGGSEGWIAEYFGDTPTEVGATVIDLGSATTTETFDASAVLDYGGLISGTITGVGGDETALFAEAWTQDSADTWYLAGRGDADPTTGDYLIWGLATGSYSVRFSDLQWPANASVYTPEYYDDKPSLPTSTSVSVNAGVNTPNIDAVLTLTGPEITEPVTAVERLSGLDRYGTSAEIAQKFTATGGEVFVASGENFPDALSIGPVAAKFNAPLLLTPKNTLPPLIKAELERLEPVHITVVGGEGAVSAAVYDELATLADAISRIGGSDRYETSRLIAEQGFGASGTNTAFIATGRDFPDALSAASAAAQLNAPVVLVDGKAGTVDGPTADLVGDLGVSSLFIAGGTGVVTAAMESSLSALAGVSGVERLSGSNRYLTSVAVNDRLFALTDTVYLATGVGFADALSGAALAGATGAPLYVVMPNCVPQQTLASIVARQALTTRLLGGTGALSANVAALEGC